MKKTIITTHIDTGGHGYLSVSKKDFILAGGNPEKVTGYSGHNFTRIYLEEDCDQTYFWDVATANGFTIVRKSGYNLNFNINHGFNPKLFNYIPKVGDYVLLFDDVKYQITQIKPNGRIIVKSLVTGVQYGISKSNPFMHIKEFLKN